MRRLFIFVCLLGCASLDRDPSIAADACESDRSAGTPLQSFPGRDSSGINFSYESRVEKFSSTAHRFLWCIENKSESTPGLFHWGNRDVGDLYFGAVVNPGPPRSFIRTNSSGFQSDLRILKYQQLDSSLWRSIQPQPQTIYPRSIGQNSWTLSPPIKKVQFTQDPRLDEYKGADGLIDMVKLSQNPELFRQFVASQEKGIDYVFYSVATVPTSAEVLSLIEQRKYQKYETRDFASLSIRLSNRIALESGVPTSFIEISAFPDTAADSARLNESARLPIFLRVSRGLGADADNFPSDLTVATNIDPGLRKLLLKQPISSLRHGDAIVTVQSERFTFLRMPFSTVFPGGPR